MSAATLKLDDAQFQTLRRDMARAACLHALLVTLNVWTTSGESMSPLQYVELANCFADGILSEESSNAQGGDEGLQSSQGNANASEADHA